MSFSPSGLICVESKLIFAPRQLAAASWRQTTIRQFVPCVEDDQRWAGDR